MKLKILTILAASLTFSTGASAVTNLIDNGDFSTPFSFNSNPYGYATDYNQVTYPNSNSMVPESTIAIGANPILNHNSFVNIPGSNNMLLVNGATGGDDKAVLTYTSNALVAGSYVFSASVMNICCNPTFGGGNSPSQLLFQISQNGGSTWDNIASYTTNPSLPDAGILNSLNSPFVALSAFVFRIIDAKTDAGGNDFAIDNLSIQAAAVPGPIVGAGLPGLLMALGGLVALSRRRRSKGAIA